MLRRKNKAGKRGYKKYWAGGNCPFTKGGQRRPLSLGDIGAES